MGLWDPQLVFSAKDEVNVSGNDNKIVLWRNSCPEIIPRKGLSCCKEYGGRNFSDRPGIAIPKSPRAGFVLKGSFFDFIVLVGKIAHGCISGKSPAKACKIHVRKSSPTHPCRLAGSRKLVLQYSSLPGANCSYLSLFWKRPKKSTTLPNGHRGDHRHKEMPWCRAVESPKVLEMSSSPVPPYPIAKNTRIHKKARSFGKSFSEGGDSTLSWEVQCLSAMVPWHPA